MPSKERYHRWKAQGICTNCGKNQAEGGRVWCNACNKSWHEYDKTRDNGVRRKFRQNKQQSKFRGYVWQLTIEQGSFFYTQPCHYCGEKPNGKLNGIDRQDSSIGYILENCVPCCPTCNYAKQQLSPDEFIWHCKKVVRFNKKERAKDDERYSQQTISIRK